MSNSPTTIHFVRHGTVHNPEDVFYGRLPRFGLSSEGFRQAQMLASFFTSKPIHKIVSSPLLRARQTARIIAQFLNHTHTQVTTCSYLAESHTPFDGKPIRDLVARNWDIYTGMEPPYEQPIDVFNRSFKFIQKTLKKHSGQHIVAVTHADIIVFLTLWANGYEVNFKNKSLIEHQQISIQFPSPASVTSLTWNTLQESPQFEYYYVNTR
jgi:broad specificity phosphatase PhoE